MNDLDLRPQATSAGCDHGSSLSADARSRLEALRGQSPPIRVVAAGSQLEPDGVGAVEVVDGNSNLTGAIPGQLLAEIYAKTIQGTPANPSNPVHVIGNAVSEEWVIHDLPQFIGQWSDGAEIHYVDGSNTSVADNPELLQQLHQDSVAATQPFRYAAVDILYEGFPSAQAIAALGGVAVNGTLHYYQIETVKQSTGTVTVTGRLARIHSVDANGQDRIQEHWLLSTGYAFPIPGVVARFRRADGAWSSLEDFFSSAGLAYRNGLYVQTDFVLSALP